MAAIKSRFKAANANGTGFLIIEMQSIAINLLKRLLNALVKNAGNFSFRLLFFFLRRIVW